MQKDGLNDMRKSAEFGVENQPNNLMTIEEEQLMHE